MENTLAALFESLLIKVYDLNFSQLSFIKYVTNIVLERYGYITVFLICAKPVNALRLHSDAWLASLVCTIVCHMLVFITTFGWNCYNCLELEILVFILVLCLALSLFRGSL